MAQPFATDNATDEAEACTCYDAETRMRMAEDNFPEGTLTVAVVIFLSCLYFILIVMYITLHVYIYACSMTEGNAKHANTVQVKKKNVQE